MAPYKVFVLLFSLILLSSSLFCHGQHDITSVKDRAQSRKLLLTSSLTTLSTNPPNKLSAAMEDSETSAEASLRKSPPSGSNPTQN